MYLKHIKIELDSVSSLLLAKALPEFPRLGVWAKLELLRGLGLSKGSLLSMAKPFLN